MSYKDQNSNSMNEKCTSPEVEKLYDIFKLNPSQVLVIVALLTGGLQVNSVLVDRSQNVQIVLSGSLSTEETSETEKIGRKPQKKLPPDLIETAIMPP